MKTKPHIFKTFPEFSELTFSDRARYNKLIASYPPISEYSFPTIMGWWSALDGCKIAQLNGNLVISYWHPGIDEYSGLSVLGNKNIDETIAEVLDWLNSRNDVVRLVHVPEFVISSMKYPELYCFNEERDFSECVIPVSNLSALGTMIKNTKWRVRRFLTSVEANRATLKSLDLNFKQEQEVLLESVENWRDRGGMNNISLRINDSMKSDIRNAEKLGLENICVYIDGKLHSFILFQYTPDSKYVIINYAQFSYAIPHIFEFAAHKYGEWFAEQGIEFANVECDLGIPTLRAMKLALGPTNFFRKYTIAPRK